MGGEAGQSEMAEVPLGPGRRNARERLVGGEGERLGQPRPRQSGRQSLLIESALEAHLRPLPSIPPPPLTDLKALVVSLGELWMAGVLWGAPFHLRRLSFPLTELYFGRVSRGLAWRLDRRVL